MALTVVLLMNGITFADINQGLVAYYPFNGNANDESGNANDGGVYGGATLVNDRWGNPSSAYQFDGIDDYIEVPDSLSSNEYNNFTVLVWIKTTDSQTIIDNYSNRDEAGVRTGWLLKTGDIDFFARFGLVQSPNDTAQDYYSSKFVSDGNWHLVGTSWDDSTDTVNLIVDGTIVATHYEDRHINSNDRSIKIGMWDGLNDYFYAGVIDDVRIYNRALSESEIMTLYTIRKEGNLTDSDGDGVVDEWDLCTFTPVGEATDSDGCPAKKKVIVVPLL